MRPIQSTIKLQSFADIDTNVRIFTFERPENLDFVAGQFIAILFSVNGVKYKRQYSILSAEKDPYLSLCVKKIENGPGSTYLWNLHIDDCITIIAPLGRFCLQKDATHHVLISTGTGIVPFISMIRSNPLANITLISGFRHHSLFQHELEAKQCSTLRYMPYLSKPLTHERHTVGYVQNALQTLSDTPTTHYYICGLQAMIQSTLSALHAMNVPISRIKLERYD